MEHYRFYINIVYFLNEIWFDREGVPVPCSAVHYLPHQCAAPGTGTPSSVPHYKELGHLLVYRTTNNWDTLWCTAQQGTGTPSVPHNKDLGHLLVYRTTMTRNWDTFQCTALQGTGTPSNVPHYKELGRLLVYRTTRNWAVFSVKTSFVSFKRQNTLKNQQQFVLFFTPSRTVRLYHCVALCHITLQ